MHRKLTEWTDRDEVRFREALDLAQSARKRVEAHDPLTQEHGVRVAHGTPCWPAGCRGSIAGGYPAGDMAGHDIPIEVRITSVVDVFDAVTSSLAYRPDWGTLPTHEGLDILRKAAGTSLDPTLVSLFDEPPRARSSW